MAPRTVYANLQDGLQPFTLWDASLADMGNLGIIPCTAAGTNSIVLTPIAAAQAPNVTSPNQFQSFAFVAAGASTGPVTIQNGTDAALKLYRSDGITQVGSGDISTGIIYEIKKNTALNSGAGGYQISSPPAGVVQAVVNDTNVTGSISANTLTLGWTGTLAAARLNSNVVQAVTNDTNITGSISGQNLTFTWAGTLANARLANMNAFTLKGNTTGSPAAPTDFTIGGLTQKGTPAGTDLVLIQDQAASGALKFATVSSVGASSGVSSIAGNTGAFTLSGGVTNSTNAIVVDGSFGFRNRLVNPTGQIAQITPGSTGDAAYTGFDQWYALVQTAAVAASQVVGAENGTPYMMRLTQSQASAQRFGLTQALENADCLDLRGQAVVLSARVRMSASTTLRYAIVEWTGTNDSPIKDIVNDWTSGTFTTGNFFIATTTTITATGSTALTANTLTTISLTGTVSSAVDNLLVFFWTDSTQAQNVTLDIGKVQLEVGASASNYGARPFPDELIRCQRFYAKTFPLGTTPAQSAGLNGTVQIDLSTGVSGIFGTDWVFPVRMRTTPTITTYNPSAANANWRDATNSADRVASTGSNISDTRVFLEGAGGVANSREFIHATADARL